MYNYEDDPIFLISLSVPLSVNEDVGRGREKDREGDDKNLKKHKELFSQPVCEPQWAVPSSAVEMCQSY